MGFLYSVRRAVIQLQRKRGVAVKSGQSGMEQYQRYKNDLQLLEPPKGSSPEVAEKFKKLSPLHQHQAVAALQRIKKDKSS